MKNLNILILIFSLICSTVVAQDTLKIATWSMHELNAYKLLGKSYSIDSLGFISPNDASDVAATSTMKILNQIMNNNDIDILFLQGVEPLIWENRRQIKVTNRKNDIDADFDANFIDTSYYYKTVCYYPSPDDQLKKKALDAANIDKKHRRSGVKINGECYLVIYNNARLGKNTNIVNESGWDKLLNEFTDLTKPPMEVKFSFPTGNTSIPMVIYNYQTSKKEVATELKTIIETAIKENYILLGDMGKSANTGMGLISQLLSKSIGDTIKTSGNNTDGYNQSPDKIITSKSFYNDYYNDVSVIRTNKKGAKWYQKKAYNPWFVRKLVDKNNQLDTIFFSNHAPKIVTFQFGGKVIPVKKLSNEKTDTLYYGHYGFHTKDKQNQNTSSDSLFIKGKDFVSRASTLKIEIIKGKQEKHINDLNIKKDGTTKQPASSIQTIAEKFAQKGDTTIAYTIKSKNNAWFRYDTIKIQTFTPVKTVLVKKKEEHKQPKYFRGKHGWDLDKPSDDLLLKVSHLSKWAKKIEVSITNDPNDTLDIKAAKDTKYKKSLKLDDKKEITHTFPTIQKIIDDFEQNANTTKEYYVLLILTDKRDKKTTQYISLSIRSYEKVNLYTARGTNDEKETVFFQARGHNCQEPGDDIYALGEKFPQNDDVNLVINNIPPIKRKVSVNNKGKFSTILSNASDLIPRSYILEARDDNNYKTFEFSVAECTHKSQPPSDSGHIKTPPNYFPYIVIGVTTLVAELGILSYKFLKSLAQATAAAEEIGEEAANALGDVLDDGDDPNGDDPNGDDPNGDDPNGDDPNGDDPNGDDPNGDDPNGDDPNGDDPNGDGGASGASNGQPADNSNNKGSDKGGDDQSTTAGSETDSKDLPFRFSESLVEKSPIITATLFTEVPNDTSMRGLVVFSKILQFDKLKNTYPNLMFDNNKNHYWIYGKTKDIGEFMVSEYKNTPNKIFVFIDNKDGKINVYSDDKKNCEYVKNLTIEARRKKEGAKLDAQLKKEKWTATKPQILMSQLFIIRDGIQIVHHPAKKAFTLHINSAHYTNLSQFLRFNYYPKDRIGETNAIDKILVPNVLSKDRSLEVTGVNWSKLSKIASNKYGKKDSDLPLYEKQDSKTGVSDMIKIGDQWHYYISDLTKKYVFYFPLLGTRGTYYPTSCLNFEMPKKTLTEFNYLNTVNLNHHTLTYVLDGGMYGAVANYSKYDLNKVYYEKDPFRYASSRTQSFDCLQDNEVKLRQVTSNSSFYALDSTKNFKDYKRKYNYVLNDSMFLIIDLEYIFKATLKSTDHKGSREPQLKIDKLPTRWNWRGYIPDRSKPHVFVLPSERKQYGDYPILRSMGYYEDKALLKSWNPHNNKITTQKLDFQTNFYYADGASFFKAFPISNNRIIAFWSKGRDVMYSIIEREQPVD